MEFEITGVNGKTKTIKADVLKVLPEGISLQDKEGNVTGWINPGAVAFVVAEEPRLLGAN